MIRETDLASAGFGMPWSHTRTYSNRMSEPFNRGQGWNWNPENWPFVIESRFPDSTYAILGNLNSIPYILRDESGNFITLFGGLEKFSHVDDEFHWLSPEGVLTKFNDLSHATRPGLFKGWVSPGGTTLSIEEDGENLSVTREFSDGTDTVTESFYYDFESVGALLSVVQIILRRKINSDPWVDVSKVDYDYYGESEDFGNWGDLKTVDRSEWVSGAWQAIDTRYYRYYKPEETNGAPHGIKSVFGPQAFENLRIATGDPFGASDGVALLYADNYYKYEDVRVIEEQINGGSRTTLMSYEENPDDPGSSFNFWARKTTETRSDETLVIIFMNRIGQEMLRVETPSATSSDQWLRFTRYDDTGRVVGVAESSAISGYDENLDDLMGWDGTRFAYVKDHEGLITTTEYYDDGAIGYVKSQSILNGQAGSPVKLQELEYVSQTANSQTIYLVSKEHRYPSDAGTSPVITTEYGYTFYPDTLQVKEKTTTWPTIPTGQNGSGSATHLVEVFDEFNNLIWSKDERGFITHITYNPATGAPIQRIDDVDTGAVSGAPAGWTTPSGGGLNLVTDFESDHHGRITRTLDPAQTIDVSGMATEVRRAAWTVFQDAEHQRWSAAGYLQTSNDAETLINPVSITKVNFNGAPTDEILAVRASTAGPLQPSDSFPQSSYVAWKTYQYSDCCKLISSRLYHTIPSSGDGSPGTNYDETTYGYDLRDRQTRTTSPGGTISWTVFDIRSLPVGTYVGTNDDGATETDPTGGSINPNNNMVAVVLNEYDDGVAGGDGNLTRVTQLVDVFTSRVLDYGYDWRDRRITATGPEAYFEKWAYDNLNRTTRVERYNTSEAGPLLSRNETLYDDLSRVYQRISYAVDPSSGAVGNALTDNVWYDPAGNLAKSLSSGSSLFSKTIYDSLNRPSRRYAGYDLDESSYADIGSVTDDTIMEQIEFTYDDASNTIQTVSRQRYHDAPATQTGGLNGPTGPAPKARVTHSAQWPDALGRTVAAASYGTNGGSAPTRPDTIPAASDTVLVSSTEFDDAGRPSVLTDPAGMITHVEYDDAGRRTKVIENVQTGGGSSSSSSGGCSPSAAANRTTTFTYTADGAQATITAWNTATTNQTTTYTYGTTRTESDVASSILLSKITYPDSIGGGDVVSLTYNRQGQRKKLTDQRGCVHTYDYDDLGRPVHDRVTTLGTGVDAAVQRLSTSYDVRGLVETLTSYNNPSVGSGSVVNQVQFAYNDFRQRTTAWQAHSGAVNTGTSPKVQTAYASGAANTVRPTKQTYPDGRELHWTYGASGGIDDALSRLRVLLDDDVTTQLADYAYLGLGVPVKQSSTEADLLYTLVGSTNDPDTGDIYTGLDRFGRVKDVRWQDVSAGTDLSRVQYGYDRASNRTWRKNPTDTSNHQDWLYGYDGLHRLKGAGRGTLNGTQTAITSPQFAQCWTLDETGNWSGFRQADGGSAWTLEQARSASTVNEISSIANTTGPAWAQPAYDAAGNMTTIPTPSRALSWANLSVDDWAKLTVDEWANLPVDAVALTSYTATYDAWNRLVKLTNGSDTVQENAYDARNYRTVRKDYISGGLNETRHFYYSDGWQVLEERLGSSSTPDRQFVWGNRYLDDLLLRDSTTTTTLDERLYAVQDANWNVTTLVNTSGAVQERYEYDPYGNTSVLSPTFTPRTASNHAWETTYAGYRTEATTGLFAVRNRLYQPRLGAWLTRDPLAAELNLYTYIYPVSSTDPLGLESPLPGAREYVYPLRGQPAHPGDMTWTQGGKSYGVCPKLTQDWKAATNRTGWQEFKDYWNPWGSDQTDVETLIRTKANFLDHSERMADPNYDPFAGDVRRAANKRELMGRDFDRTTRGLDAACTVGAGAFALTRRLPGALARAAAPKEPPLGLFKRTTVIGKFDDLKRFKGSFKHDTWLKSGRIPTAGEPPVLWKENQQWLDYRLLRGDDFGLATDPATLPKVVGGYIPGQPNGYSTARELRYLNQQGINPTLMLE